MNYTAIAPLYDKIMAHVQYDAWRELVRRVCAAHIPTTKPARVLELGAGTGVLGAMLTRGSRTYHASDLSPAMCREAKRRGLCVFCADARALPVRTRFDLALFLYDGINYLRNLDEYASLFHEVHRCLEPGGCFLFDITTEPNSLENFDDVWDHEELDHATYIRHSYYDRKRRIQHNDFTVFSRATESDDLYQKRSEHHVQYIFSPQEIANAVPGKLLTVLGIWDGFSSKKPYAPRSERVHFLLQRKAPS